MKNPYQTLFSAGPDTTETDRLCSEVMGRIARREKALIRLRAAGFGLVAAAAIVCFVPAIRYLSASLGTSGLGQYASLFLSDSSYMLSHWQDSLMTVAGSLPVMAAAVITALIMVSLVALRRFSNSLVSLRFAGAGFSGGTAQLR